MQVTRGGFAIARASFAIALAAALGCSGPAPTPPVPSCAPPVCKTAPLKYAVEVVPAASPPGTPASQTLLPFELADVDVSSGTFIVTLPRSVELTGAVQVGAERQTLQSSVFAARPSRILGRPDVVYHADIGPREGGTTGYDMAVTPTLAGELYALRVIATGPGDDYPPQLYRVPASSDPTQFDLVLDSSSQLVQVIGHVTSAVMVGIPGVTVQAFDQVSGLPISTAAVTADDGSYDLRLSRQITDGFVILRATPPTSDRPTLTERLDVSHGVSNTVSNAFTELAMPATPNPQPFTYAIVGTSVSGALTPIASATCTFTAQLPTSATRPDFTAVFTQTAVSGTSGASLGYVTLDLIPTSAMQQFYDVTITPPASSEFATLHLPMFLAGGQAGGVSTLPTFLADRPKLTGRALDAGGTPLANVVVTAAAPTVQEERNGTLPATPAALPTVLTDTIDKGRFSLPLDSNTYDVELVPPTNLGLATLWLDRESVLDDLDLGDVELPIATTVHGRVVDADGAQVANAEVRVYSVDPANAACMANDLQCLHPPRLLASEPTDASGTATLLLPGIAPAPSAK